MFKKNKHETSSIDTPLFHKVSIMLYCLFGKLKDGEVTEGSMSLWESRIMEGSSRSLCRVIIK